MLPGAITMAGEPSATPEIVDQIVVVAHKDRRSIHDVAANVTALSRDDLQAELASSIDDVFRYVPGVESEATGVRFRTEGINIRGISGNRVAILVDGVPISDQFDIGSFSNATRDLVDTGLIQDIEVLHGPASALYGSSAIGGVVALRTPDPHHMAGTNGLGGDIAVAWHQADQSLHRRAELSVGGRSVGLIVGASRQEGEQMQSAALDAALDTREQKRRTDLAKLRFDDDQGNTLRASMIHQQSDVESELGSELGMGRYQSTTALIGDDSHVMNLASVAYDFGVPRGPFNDGVVTVFAARTDVRQSTIDVRANAETPVSIDRYFAFEQESQGIELNLWKNLAGNAFFHRLGYGFEYRERRTDELRDAQQTSLSTGELTKTILGEVFPLRDFPVSRSVETGAYIEDTISVGRWTIIAAIRADRLQLRPHLDEVYAADNPSTTPVSLDESDVSPKLGLVHRISSDVDIYAQYAHGFRAPPYSDANIGLDIPLFNIRAIPNPDLKSESSDGFEAGLRIIKPHFDLHLGVFHTRYADFIETKARVGVDPVSGRLLFQSRNISKATIQGVEAAFSRRFGGDRRAFGLDASAYFAVGENGHNGQPINSVGPAQAVMGLSWNSANARQQLRLKAVLTSRWRDRDESGGDLFKPPGHAVVDLYYARRLGRHAAIRTGVRNLANRTYWRWTDVRGLSPDDPVLPSIARAGRNISIDVTASW